MILGNTRVKESQTEHEIHADSFFFGGNFFGAICQNVLQTYKGLLVRIVTTA